MVRDHSGLQQRNNSNQAISNPWMSNLSIQQTPIFFWDITMDKILSWLPRIQQWEKQIKIPGLQYLTKPLQYLWLTPWNIFTWVHISFVFLSLLNLKMYEGRKSPDMLIPIFSVPIFMPCIKWTLKIYWHWVKE